MWGSSLMSNYGSKALGMAGKYGRTVGAAGRTATYGAGIGGLYGALADDTSMIGGAMMGAGIGLGGRYGRSGLRSANRALGRAGQVPYGLGSAFTGGVSRRVGRDIATIGVRANRAVNAIAGRFPNITNAYGYRF